MTIGNYSPLSSYKHGCRCDECVTAVRKYDKGRRVDAARGIDRMVSTKALRRHVESLTSAGMSRRSIAMAAGYGDGTSLNVTLNRDMVRTVTARKIMSVTLKKPKSGIGWVQAHGATRRLRALACMGWKLRDVADKAGINIDTASDIRQGTATRIHERVHDSIANVYDKISMINGGDVRSTLRAQREDWIPPLAWDDIDDPTEKPKR